MVQALQCAVHDIQLFKTFQDIMETESQKVCPKKNLVVMKLYQRKHTGIGQQSNENVRQGSYKK